VLHRMPVDVTQAGKHRSLLWTGHASSNHDRAHGHRRSSSPNMQAIQPNPSHPGGDASPSPTHSFTPLVHSVPQSGSSPTVNSRSPHSGRPTRRRPPPCRTVGGPLIELTGSADGLCCPVSWYCCSRASSDTRVSTWRRVSMIGVAYPTSTCWYARPAVTRRRPATSPTGCVSGAGPAGGYGRARTPPGRVPVLLRDVDVRPAEAGAVPPRVDPRLGRDAVGVGHTPAPPWNPPPQHN
jgi:hypothetical protein